MRGKMRRKRFQYWDVKIFNPKSNRVYYLRHKRNVRSNELTVTARTHKDGKGTAKTKPVSADYSELVRVWQKIDKKFPFKFVELRDVPEA